MKKITNPLIIVVLFIIILVLSLQRCDEKNVPVHNNSENFEKIEFLKDELNELSVLNTSLSIKYKEVLQRKDSVRMMVKNKYIQVFDTISQTTIDCLPKEYVDSLIFMQDSTDKICGQNLSVKDSIIENLTNQNNIKDTIIIDLKKEIKRQKRGKIKAFIVGIGTGAFIRQLF